MEPMLPFRRRRENFQIPVGIFRLQVSRPGRGSLPRIFTRLLAPFADAKHPAADRSLNMRPNFLNVCFNALTMRWGFDDPKHPIPQNNKVRDHISIGRRKEKQGECRDRSSGFCAVRRGYSMSWVWLRPLPNQGRSISLKNMPANPCPSLLDRRGCRSLRLAISFET